nr:uncharacterized oxidoreductase At4g09670-like [Coffea arabica]
MAEQDPVKFGILGCAEIARKVSRAIRLSPNSTLYAVGSRSVEKAAKFAKDNGFPDSAKVFGGYDAVLDDPDVDAVYIPLPTSMHVKWAVLAAQKKKHVLLEKPVALNVKELDVILEACESHGVQFMDGTMWMHHPRTAKMKEFLNDPQRFGQLKTVQTVFTFAADPEFLENDVRVKPELDALGVLGDAGWYNVRACLWAFDYELPKKVTALPGPVFNKSGVLVSCGASLYWEDGKVATFHCSFLSTLTTDVTAVGTKGYLRLHDFVIPDEEDKASFFTRENPGFAELQRGVVADRNEHVVATDLPQEVKMVMEFSRLVGIIKAEGGKPEKIWPTFSRKTQLVLDAVKTSIEKGFESVELIS